MTSTVNSISEAAEADSALFALDPAVSRDEWVTIGMAYRAAGGSFETFDQWSSGATNYDGRAARDTWRSFSDDGGIKKATLFYLAKQAGWTGGWRTDTTSPRANGRRVPSVQAQEASPARMLATEVWDTLEPAPDTHPYVVAKGGIAEGLRIVPTGHPLVVNGQSVAGWLAVPVAPLGSTELSSIQFIPPAGGEKLNLPGGRLKGGVFVVGSLNDGCAHGDAAKRAYVCEGIATAWACFLATAAPAVTAFGWSNVETALVAVRSMYPDWQVTLVPDRGKDEAADDLASEHGALVAHMPAHMPSNYDADDYARDEGREALRALLDRARPRYDFLTVEQVVAAPSMSWVVENVLPAEGMVAIYGPSGSGKSFLALHMAANVAEGGEWFGYPTKQTPVIYVVLEGASGIGQRARALEEWRGAPLPETLRLSLQPLSLASPRDVRDFVFAAKALGPGVVTIIDTLSRAALGIDENSSRDMGQVIRAAEAIQRETKGLVVLVHHTGKNVEAGPRGHSSLYAALDAALFVSGKQGVHEWAIRKVKDGEDGHKHRFRLEAVDGDDYSSCVVVPHGPDGTPKSVKGPGKTQRKVLEALAELLAEQSNPTEGVAEETVIELVCQRSHHIPSNRRKSVVTGALKSLEARGSITRTQGKVRLPEGG